MDNAASCPKCGTKRENVNTAGTGGRAMRELAAGRGGNWRQGEAEWGKARRELAASMPPKGRMKKNEGATLPIKTTRNQHIDAINVIAKKRRAETLR